LPPKILLVTSSYLPIVGGLQTVASGLAGELLGRGYAVEVITARVPRTLPALERIDGVAVRRWTFLAPRISAPWARGPVAGRARRIAGYARAPAAAHRPRAVDIVNLQFAGSPALFVLLARRLRRFRLVVSLHGDEVEGVPHRSALNRTIWGRSCAARTS
jgi:glycosyltransferase involved in cell wall biosynthesis